MNTRHQCFRCFVAVSVRQAIAVGAPLLERQQDGCAEMNAVKLKSVVQCMYICTFVHFVHVGVPKVHGGTDVHTWDQDGQIIVVGSTQEFGSSDDPPE